MHILGATDAHQVTFVHPMDGHQLGHQRGRRVSTGSATLSGHQLGRRGLPAPFVTWHHVPKRPEDSGQFTYRACSPSATKASTRRVHAGKSAR